MTVKTREGGYAARRAAGYLTPLLIFACLKYQPEAGEQEEQTEMERDC